MIISERIFKIMEEKGISQIECARRTGISQITISDWKRKKTNPAADKIMCICNVLNVTPYEILQDSIERRSGVDYILLGEDDEAFELIEMYKSLDDKQRSRLMGYADALRSIKK